MPASRSSNRDLSKAGKSSPSVHNKFVVESDVHGNAIRVLAGSTNWTTTGLCTQLNNVLIIENATIAKRYLDQWGKLVAAGNDMPPALKTSNSTPTTDSNGAGGLDLYRGVCPGRRARQLHLAHPTGGGRGPGQGHAV